MYEWYPSHPEFQPYLARAHQERAEAMSRVAYLVVVGVDRLVGQAARAPVAGLRRIARGYDLWQRRRHTVQALSRLDARMLRDIGIDSPGAIDAIAAELGRDAEPAAEPAAVPRPVPATALPRLQLDLDCPDLKHAA